MAGFQQRRSSASAPSDDGDDAHFYFPIRLAVYSGVVDGRIVALAFLFSLAFSVLAYYVAGSAGAGHRRDEQRQRGQRARADGRAGGLVAVSISGLVDETAPPEMQLP